MSSDQEESPDYYEFGMMRKNPEFLKIRATIMGSSNNDDEDDEEDLEIGEGSKET